jgi:hypothetical protein
VISPTLSKRILPFTTISNLSIRGLGQVDGLNHGHGGRGAHIKVGEAVADALGLAVKDDILTMGGSNNPLATGLAPDCGTILLQLEEEEKIGNSVAHKP